MFENRSWVVCQIGAREHYSIVRALSEHGRYTTLFTDYWALQSRNYFIPNNLRQRYHGGVDTRRVISFNRYFLQFEILSRLLGRHGWKQVEARNNWFGKKVGRYLQRLVNDGEKPPVVFAYSYAAREILSIARSLGCQTILGQIDPGPLEMELVNQLYREAGMPLDDQPTEEYWLSWRRECELADYILVNSQWSYAALEKEGINVAKLKIVPLAFEPAQQRCFRTTEKASFSDTHPLKILFLGQVILRKGIVELMQAIESMEGAPVHWNIVGGGESWILDRLKKLPQTTVTGSVSRNETAGYYQDADVFILPTHSDGFALTQLEAAAYGLPVIASTYCGDVVHHGVNGLILKEVSSDGIIEAVTRLLTYPEKLADYRNNLIDMKFCSMRDLGQKLVELENKIQIDDSIELNPN